MNIKDLMPIGRKQWVQRKWQDYEDSKNTQAISRSEKAYYEPTDAEFDLKIDKSKWKATVDRKVNYLLARPPLATEHQDTMDDLLSFIRESALAYTLRGSLVWIVQGDGEAIIPRPLIMNNTIAVYSDEYREEIVAFIRKYTELDVAPETGEETELSFYECYYEGDGGVWHRDTFHYDVDGKDTEETLAEAPVFIELGKTGDAPLYAYVETLLESFDRILKHQDTTVEKNTTPLVEVKGYSGTSDADLKYAVETLSLVKVDGAGGIMLHMRSMDSVAMDLWTKRLMQEYYEATSTVGKDVELQYAQSGKAMDRLFIDMENSARQLAYVLEEALISYFEVIGYEDVDVIWNTDRPVDDAEIMNGINASRGLVSDRTLLEQHPWVDDIEEELIRREQEAIGGMGDLVEREDEEDLDEEPEVEENE